MPSCGSLSSGKKTGPPRSRPLEGAVISRSVNTYTLAETLEDRIKAFIVRGIVFIEEQDVPYVIEMDEHEESALHVLGELDGEPFAAGRIRFQEDFAKLERIAVRRAYRGSGHGHTLMEFMISQARERGYHKLKIHGQAHLSDFYRRHGFEIQGNLFQEAGIDHYLMIRDDSTAGASENREEAPESTPGTSG